MQDITGEQRPDAAGTDYDLGVVDRMVWGGMKREVVNDPAASHSSRPGLENWFGAALLDAGFVK